MASTQIALWVPGWYELDQTLALDQRQRLWLFQTPPSDLPLPSGFEVPKNTDYIFYNQLDSTTNCQIRTGKVVDMVHPTIGRLARIDTDGCDYLFFPVDGEEIVVNAEEEPGQTYIDDLKVDHWVVQVSLEDVSDPIVDST